MLIVQNDIGNKHSPTVIAAAITSRLDKNETADTYRSWRRHLRTSERFRGIVGTDPYIGQEKAKGENGNTDVSSMSAINSALSISFGLKL